MQNLKFCVNYVASVEGKRCAKNARTKGDRVTGEFSLPLPPPPPPLFAPSPSPIATVGWQYLTQCSSQFSGWQFFNKIVSKPYTPWDFPGKTSFSNCSRSLCIDSNNYSNIDSNNYIKLWNFINCTQNFVFLYICVSFYKGFVHCSMRMYIKCYGETILHK